VPFHVKITGGDWLVSSYCAPVDSALPFGFCVGAVLLAPNQVELNEASDAAKLANDVAAAMALAPALLALPAAAA
jgi:hypothetical protein